MLMGADSEMWIVGLFYRGPRGLKPPRAYPTTTADAFSFRRRFARTFRKKPHERSRPPRPSPLPTPPWQRAQAQRSARARAAAGSPGLGADRRRSRAQQDL